MIGTHIEQTKGMLVSYRNRSTLGRNSRGNKFYLVFGALVAALIIATVVGAVVSHNVTSEHTACVVTEKDRTTDRDGNSDMRVYTENCGTFSVGDNLFKGVWNSADIYSSIQEGETYDFSATGWRIPIISSFPKIHEATKVS